MRAHRNNKLFLGVFVPQAPMPIAQFGLPATLIPQPRAVIVPATKGG